MTNYTFKTKVIKNGRTGNRDRGKRVKELLKKIFSNSAKGDSNNEKR